jgi:hypothetical protein
MAAIYNVFFDRQIPAAAATCALNHALPFSPAIAGYDPSLDVRAAVLFIVVLT